MNIGLVCVKKKSHRFPGKNVRRFNGCTLFEHSLKEVLRAKCLDQILICSDDEQIEAICSQYPRVVFIKEPSGLARLNSSWRVIYWVMNNMKMADSDILFYLPCTAPLRTSTDIDTANLIFKTQGCTSLVSVRETRDPPEWSFPLNLGRLDIKDIKITSEECREHYTINGAIYISSVKNLKRYDGFFKGVVFPYIMPYERSVNIDTEHDFKKAEKLYKRLIKNEEYIY